MIFKFTKEIIESVRKNIFEWINTFNKKLKNYNWDICLIQWDIFQEDQD